MSEALRVFASSAWFQIYELARQSSSPKKLSGKHQSFKDSIQVLAQATLKIYARSFQRDKKHSLEYVAVKVHARRVDGG